MKDARTIERVVKAGLCTGCGTCAGICPRDAVQMVIDLRQGLYLPVVDRGNCNECRLCVTVCPGHAVDFRQLSRGVFGREPEDAVLGNYLHCHIGHAADYGTRYNSASGGLVTALLVFALEEGMIDGALVTRMREDRPLEPEPFIARTREEIVSAARSKYCPVPAGIALREILRASDDARFAMVGLPCHVQGTRKAETVIKRLREKEVLLFGLACSHSDTFHETDFLLRRYGIARADVSGIEYRGRGWPGYLTIRTRHGTEKSVPFHDYITAHAGYFFTPTRCTLCCDMGASLADICFMDAWLPEIMARDSIGSSIIICRTDRAVDFCRKAERKGVVDLKELAGSDVLQSLGRARMSNRDLRAHFQIARLCRRSRPCYGIDIPPSGPVNYLRAMFIHLNMGISSRKWLHGLIGPMTWVQRHIF